jgi:hypothetical protein
MYVPQGAPPAPLEQPREGSLVIAMGKQKGGDPLPPHRDIGERYGQTVTIILLVVWWRHCAANLT